MISGVTPLRGMRAQRLGVGLSPDAGEDVEPVVDEVLRRRGADSGGRAGDDDEPAIAAPRSCFSPPAPRTPLQGRP